MALLWEDKAWKEYCQWQVLNKKKLKKINSLIKEIQRTPFVGLGKPEPLKNNYKGWWSRRIDDEHRLVYKIKDGNIIIASCRNHYDDK